MKTNRMLRVSAFSVIAITVSLLCFVPTTLAAGQAQEALAKVDVAVDMFMIQPLISHSGVRVTVTGPEGFQSIREFAAGEAASVELPQLDGLYKYELRFAPVVDAETRAALDAARKAGSNPEFFGSSAAKVQAGTFSIAEGAVVEDRLEIEPKVVLTNGNGVIRNSLCVGFDCPDSPAFDDSTILMMENNNRIKFGDTSVGSFPGNDWEIEANSNLNGGASYLGFNDCGSADNDGGCATDLVFAVEAGARQSALFVESDGDVGLGTSNPVLDLHIVTGNSPGLRLDQDTSSGFASQVWDVVGNETSFFIRDVTSGSTLPFRIRPGAPSNSLVIDTDGDVGIGTLSPAADLQVVGSTAADLTVQAAGPARLNLQNTTKATWSLNSTNGGAGNFTISTGAGELTLNPTSGDLTIAGGLITTGGGGACTGGDPCDGVFKPGFKVPSIEEHAASMWENSYLPAVGPTLENGPINVTQTLGGVLNELEKAHIYIEQLNSGLEAQQQVIEELRSRLAKLESAE